jgi:ABC-type anion transport system duplicated permease subunit
VGMMKVITSNTAAGNIGIAAWTSFLFAITVVVFGIVFTRKLIKMMQNLKNSNNDHDIVTTIFV